MASKVLISFCLIAVFWMVCVFLPGLILGFFTG